jgi:thymidylate kinase
VNSQRRTAGSLPDRSSETPFLVNLFEQFNEAGVSYCVLRNYENLPYMTGDSDIDMLIAEEHFDNANQILQSVASSFNGKCISKMVGYHFLCNAFCGHYEGKWWAMRFDIFSYAGICDYQIFPVRHVLARSFVHNDVRVANRNDSAILSFLKEVIGCASKKYMQDAIDAFARESQTYIPLFENVFGHEICQNNVVGLLSGAESDFLKTKKTLRRALSQTFFRKYLFKMLKMILDRWRFRMARIQNKPGVCIAVLGPDGVGKSTIIEQIRPVIEKALHTKAIYRHLRPGFLPSLNVLFGGRDVEATASNPHGSKPSGFIVSLLRLSYYTTDYVVGYWLKVFPKIARQPCLYIFDRYYYDYHFDPARSRIALSQWIIKLFGIFIPRPDIILCLGAEPKMIHARKPELDIEELCRQTKRLKHFCDGNPVAVWIDTGQELEISLDQAIDAVTSRMADRYEKQQCKAAEHYAGLPFDKPRVFFPTRTRRLRAKGMEFHIPGSHRARFILCAAKWLSDAGLKFHLARTGIPMPAPIQNMIKNNSLRQWLSSRLQRPVDDLVFYAGSDSVKKKITALAVCADDLDVVVKIADSKGGMEAICQESEALRLLSATTLADQVPKLLFEEQWNGLLVQCQSVVKRDYKKQITCLTETHLVFLAELSRFDRKSTALKDTELWLELENRYNLSSAEELPVTIKKAWDIIRKRFSDKTVICHRTHGDFAPWNIALNNGRISVFDWEDSQQYGVEFTDIFHFLYRQASEVGPWSGAGYLLKSIRTFCALLSSRARYPQIDMSMILLLCMIREYCAEPQNKIVEMLEVFFSEEGL